MAGCALALCVANFASTTAAADSGPADGCKPGSESLGFWQRLSDSYQEHLFPGDGTAPAPDPNAPFDEQAAGYRKKIPPPPFTNPPWPYAVYNEGETNLIGYENMFSSALMDALYPCMNGLNNQNFGWNNIQHAVATWYHKFNEHCHMHTEAWYI